MENLSEYSSGQSLKAALAAGKLRVGDIPFVKEEDVVRVKELDSLIIPLSPEDTTEARGYINTVLTAIGAMQKCAGTCVYEWGQQSLDLDEAQLERLGDGGLPRLQRELTLKIIKANRKGRFSTMIAREQEKARKTSSGMCNGRILLHRIFRKFKVELDRANMLTERQLLAVEMPDGATTLTQL